MKKSLTLLLLVSFIQGFAYNGAERHDIPSSLQSGVFTTSKSRLAIDSAHKLLITSIGAGLIVFDGTNYSNFNTLNSGIASDTTNDVAVDMNNQYFVASESGMSVYNGAAWLNYTPSNSSLISKQLKTIFAHNNTVYVGGYKGFSIFTNGVFSNFSTSNSPLPNDTINAFAVDANSDVWIATNNGLCKWNGSTLSVFTTSNSALPFNRVNSLLTEGTNVWLLNQNAGITRMQNASFSALTTLANTPLTFSYSTRLSRGPKGGLLFINYSKNQICEYFEGRIYTYFLRTSFIFTPLCAQVFDSTGNKLWMSSLGRQIVSLDFNSYQNTLSSLNTSPPGVPPITAENCQSLDINQVNSAILNLGDMCWDGNDVKFEVPKGSGKHAIFANSLWIGGLTGNGNLRVAAQTYRQSGIDFWPGPLDTLTASTDTAKAAQYNRIWKINRQEIEDFKTNFMNGTVQNGSFIPAEAILTWPTSDTGNYSRKMAPFVDANSDGIYNPITGGDYPLIRGDQMLYWVFNDNLGIHTESDGAPLKVEVHASAYAFNNPWLSTSDSLLNYTTFYHYEIFNRSSDALDSCYMANWIDFDLGNPNDDAYGSIVQKNVVYCYNADSVDNGNGTNNYGSNPPIISAVILNGPIAYPNDGVDNNNNGIIDEAGERNQMTKSIFYDNNFSLSGNPSVSYHYYNYLNGKWKDNSSLTYGGNGYGGTIPQRFIWPDYPTTPGGWYQNSSSDGRMVQSCGPFHFAPGAKVDYDFAFFYSRDTNLAYNTAAYYNNVSNNAVQVENWFKQSVFPALGIDEPENLNLATQSKKLLLSPNPAKEMLHFNFSDYSSVRNMKILDPMGKLILNVKTNTSSIAAQSVDISALATGIYYLQVNDLEGKSFCEKFIKSK